MAIAIGSVTEVENHLQRGYDGGAMAEADYTELTASAIEVRKMLIGLRRTLSGQPRTPRVDIADATSDAETT